MKYKRNLSFNLQGMTLIELMIVLVVISFLTVMIVGFLRSQVLKGNDARRKADLGRIKIAVEEYEKDENCYPTDPNILDCTNGNGLIPYLDKINCDPATNESYVYEYEDSTCPRWYRIYSKLDNLKDTSLTSGIGPEGAYNYYVSSANAPTPTQTGGSSTGYYGCKSGLCVGISFIPETNIPECSTNYTDMNCNDTCGTTQNPLNECVAN